MVARASPHVITHLMSNKMNRADNVSVCILHNIPCQTENLLS